MDRVIVLLGIFLAACAAPSQTASPIDETEIVTVTVEASDGALIANWRLPAPVEMFEFMPDIVPGAQRAEEWSLADETWSFDGQQLSKADGSKFDRFSFEVRAATKFYDRRYVPVEKVGTEGWAILSNAFAPNGASHRLRFEGFDDDNTIYANGVRFDLDSSLSGEDSGIVYIGPCSQVTVGAATMIAGDNIPDWLTSKVSGDLENASAKLTQRLGRAPKTPPTVQISYEPEWNSRSYKGGVLKDVITVHLRGLDLSEPDRHFLGYITNLTVHESVHVWNGTMFKSTENSEQSWVHEGSAEYIANRLWMDDQAFKIAATSALNQCRMSLGSNSILMTETASRGRTPYNCGHLVHLIAEQAALKQAGRDVLDLWREVFDRSELNEDQYDSALFLDVVKETAGESARQPIDRLIEGLSDDQVSAFESDLADIGIQLSPISEATIGAEKFDLSGTVLRRLLFGYCNGAHGYWTKDSSFKLNTEDRCGTELADDPEVTHFNGHSLIEEPVKVYFAAKSACASDSEIIFTTIGGADLVGVSCPAPLKALPDLYEITEIEHLRPL